jgi:hypothetical protein
MVMRPVISWSHFQNGRLFELIHCNSKQMSARRQCIALAPALILRNTKSPRRCYGVVPPDWEVQVLMKDRAAGGAPPRPFFPAPMLARD